MFPAPLGSAWLVVQVVVVALGDARVVVMFTAATELHVPAAGFQYIESLARWSATVSEATPLVASLASPSILVRLAIVLALNEAPSAVTAPVPSVSTRDVGAVLSSLTVVAVPVP